MEPILVYGHPLGSSMGLIAAFEWLGQPYRLTRVKMVEEMLTPEFTRLNGRQETPVLITHEGQVITETIAITSWLESRDVERRISFGPASRESHSMHQLIGFLNTGFTGAFSPLWSALEMTPPDPGYQEALRRYGREQVRDRHRRLEQMIGDASHLNGPYLMGETPRLADAVFAGVARWADFHEVFEPGAFPRVERLKQRLHDDAAVKFALRIEDGETPESPAFRGHVPLRDALAMARIDARE